MHPSPGNTLRARVRFFVGAAAGVMKDIPAGETWGGMPARPIRHWLKETAWLARMASRRGGQES